jgi:hypothetical protein
MSWYPILEVTPQRFFLCTCCHLRKSKSPFRVAFRSLRCHYTRHYLLSWLLFVLVTPICICYALIFPFNFYTLNQSPRSVH